LTPAGTQGQQLSQWADIFTNGLPVQFGVIGTLLMGW
jgi:hypothetical protein